MYAFTLAIEIIVRHYCRLSLLLILQSNNLYRYLNYITVYNNKKGVCVYFHTFIYVHILHDLTNFENYVRN